MITSNTYTILTYSLLYVKNSQTCTKCMCTYVYICMYIYAYLSTYFLAMSTEKDLKQKTLMAMSISSVHIFVPNHSTL